MSETIIHRLITHAGPAIPEGFLDRMTQIGGRHAVTGMPNYTAEWGGTQTVFRKDRWRIKYPAAVATFEEITNVKTVDTETLAEGLVPFDENLPEQVREALMKGETHFLFLTTLYTPIKQTVQAEEGKTRWYVAEYWGPERFSEHRWKHFRKNRKGEDLLGEFPRKGMYRAFCMLEQGTPEELAAGKGLFRDLDDSVLRDLKRKVFEQAHTHDDGRDEESIIDDLYEEADEPHRLAAAAFRERIRDGLSASRSIVGKLYNQPTVYLGGLNGKEVPKAKGKRGKARKARKERSAAL